MPSSIASPPGPARVATSRSRTPRSRSTARWRPCGRTTRSPPAERPPSITAASTPSCSGKGRTGGRFFTSLTRHGTKAVLVQNLIVEAHAAAGLGYPRLDDGDRVVVPAIEDVVQVQADVVHHAALRKADPRSQVVQGVAGRGGVANAESGLGGGAAPFDHPHVRRVLVGRAQETAPRRNERQGNIELRVRRVHVVGARAERDVLDG